MSEEETRDARARRLRATLNSPRLLNDLRAGGSDGAEARRELDAAAEELAKVEQEIDAAGKGAL